MSTTRDVFRDLMQLQERMNRLFDQALVRGAPPQEELESGAWVPPVDIQETPDRIVLRADLPGVEMERIELQIHEDRLTLRGERNPAPGIRREELHRAERPAGSFHRMFNLPPGVDQGAVRAELKNGVLEVTLPKRKGHSSRQIKVEAR